MSQAHLTLHELLPPQELATALDAGHVTRKAHPELPLSIYTYTYFLSAATCKLTAWQHQRNTHAGAQGNSTPICPARFAMSVAAAPTFRSCSKSAGGQKSPSRLGRKPSSTFGRPWGGLVSLADRVSQNGPPTFGQCLNPVCDTTRARTLVALRKSPAEGSASITGTHTCDSRASNRAVWPRLAPATSPRRAIGGFPHQTIPTPTGTAGSSNTAKSWPTGSGVRYGRGRTLTTKTVTGSIIGPRTLNFGSRPSRQANAQAISSHGRKSSSKCTEKRSSAASPKCIGGGCHEDL